MTQGTVYRTLAKMYGWSFETIANMTPHQQWEALITDNEDTDSEYVTFQDMRAYNAWLKEQRNG